MPLKHENKEAANLRELDLIDLNPNAEPIDVIGDLLAPYQEKFWKENLHNDRKPFVAPVIFCGCKIHSLRGMQETIDLHLEIRSCLLLGEIIFFQKKINGNLTISNSLVQDEADFSYMQAEGEVDFSGTKFSNLAAFESSNFYAECKFKKSIFLKDTTFAGSNFYGKFDFRGVAASQSISFNSCNFREEGHFLKSHFKGPFYCRNSIFQGFVGFDYVTFTKGATFQDSFFNKHAGFINSIFEKFSWFSDSTFEAESYFWKAKFFEGVSFLYADLRKAKMTKGYLPLQPCKDWQYLFDSFQWERIRSLGELSLLTRSSYFALAGVPLLAGLWGPIRTWILQMNEGLDEAISSFQDEAKSEGWDKLLETEGVQRFLELLSSSTLPESMPTGWLMAFSAAFSIVIGHFIYQIRAPDLVKQYKEEDLLFHYRELLRRGEKITNSWLSESVDYLRDAWQRMPHRHSAWFVKRGLRTVWIPDNVEKHFTDALKDAEKPEDAPDSWKPPIAEQEVTAEDRKRIAIEEGQKARYAIEVFTNRTSAWFSGGFYVIGGVLTAFILIRQFSYVLAASPAYDWTWQWLQAISKGWVVSAVAALLLVLIFTGAYYVEEPTKRKDV